MERRLSFQHILCCYVLSIKRDSQSHKQEKERGKAYAYHKHKTIQTRMHFRKVITYEKTFREHSKNAN